MLALLLCAAGATAAEFKAASLFQDHMVLQREKPVKVWGSLTTGDEVTVSFAGQTKTATADKDGKWMVTLNPMPASSDGRTMTVDSTRGRQKSGIKDVLVCEVWLCSGQSNMSYSMSRFRNCADEVPHMKYPMIREFKTVRVNAPTPQDDALGA